MDELKSAWEIAQERASRLGGLSAEEKERQERQTYAQLGQALARKWLEGPREIDMTAELDKYEGEERDIIMKAIIEHLAKAIELAPVQSTDRPRRIVEAIGSLAPELRPKADEIGRLIQEYEEAGRKIAQEVEGAHREALHQLRISGTAVDVAKVEADPGSQSARQKLIDAFAPRLHELKQALLS